MPLATCAAVAKNRSAHLTNKLTNKSGLSAPASPPGRRPFGRHDGGSKLTNNRPSSLNLSGGRRMPVSINWRAANQLPSGMASVAGRSISRPASAACHFDRWRAALAHLRSRAPPPPPPVIMIHSWAIFQARRQLDLVPLALGWFRLRTHAPPAGGHRKELRAHQSARLGAADASGPRRCNGPAAGDHNEE